MNSIVNRPSPPPPYEGEGNVRYEVQLYNNHSNQYSRIPCGFLETLTLPYCAGTAGTRTRLGSLHVCCQLPRGHIYISGTRTAAGCNRNRFVNHNGKALGVGVYSVASHCPPFARAFLRRSFLLAFARSFVGPHYDAPRHGHERTEGCGCFFFSFVPGPGHSLFFFHDAAFRFIRVHSAPKANPPHRIAHCSACGYTRAFEVSVTVIVIGNSGIARHTESLLYTDRGARVWSSVPIAPTAQKVQSTLFSTPHLSHNTEGRRLLVICLCPLGMVSRHQSRCSPELPNP